MSDDSKVILKDGTATTPEAVALVGGTLAGLKVAGEGGQDIISDLYCLCKNNVQLAGTPLHVLQRYGLVNSAGEIGEEHKKIVLCSVSEGPTGLVVHPPYD